MTTMTEEALYRVGQLVEYRDHSAVELHRPFEHTGRITRVERVSATVDGYGEDSGGWCYTIEAAGDRPRANGGKYQTNVRPLFEEGDVVRVDMDPKCRDGVDAQGEPNGYVDRSFRGVEATIRSHYDGNIRNANGDYDVFLGEGRGAYNLISPEHLTLVRKANDPIIPTPQPPLADWERALLETAPAQQPWEPKVGDEVLTPEWPAALYGGSRDYNTTRKVRGRIENIRGSGDRNYQVRLLEGARSQTTSHPMDRARDELERVAPAVDPNVYPQWKPQVGDLVELEDSSQVTVTSLYDQERNDFGFHYAGGGLVSSSQVTWGSVKLHERPEPEKPFNVRDLQRGAKVEVYADEGGHPFAPGHEYITPGDGLGTWQVGEVEQTDTGDVAMPLGVRAEGAEDWWWFKSFQIRQATPDEERREFDWHDVQVGDRVEVYIVPFREDVGSAAVEIYQEGGRWVAGEVVAVEDRAYTGYLPLEVRAEGGTRIWRRNGTVRWPLESPLPELELKTAAQPDALERAKKAAVDAAVAELKSQIADKAMAVAKEHGWCSETEEALRLMGIDPNIQLGGEVTVRFRVSAELMSRAGGTPVLVDNPARYLKENIVPKLEGLGGLTAHDVEVLEVSVNRVSKTRKETAR